jgi:hypothetical protein
MAKWRITLTMMDRDGRKRETGITLPSLSSFEEGLAWVSAMETHMTLLSNARVTSAALHYTTQPAAPQAPSPGSNVFNRLYVICTNALDYAAWTVPSPGDLPYDTQGPYEGIRVSEGEVNLLPIINDLRALLAQSITPSGNGFPTQRIILAKGWNQ